MTRTVTTNDFGGPFAERMTLHPASRFEVTSRVTS